MVEEILNSFEVKKSTHVTLCDLFCAFDCNPHNLILIKMEHSGLGEVALRVVSSYLSNRKQIEIYNGTNYSGVNIRYSMPKDSIMGLLLFLVAINDQAFIVLLGV